MKVLIIGNGLHGKDTVAQMISDNTGIKFEGSSIAAAKIFLYDDLKDQFGCKNFTECFDDRRNNRSLWHQKIAEYNKVDKARLTKDILGFSDIYVGMRSADELNECKKQGLFDIIIGVFDPNKPLESKDSFDIDLFQHSDYIVITGDLEKVKSNVERFCKILK